MEMRRSIKMKRKIGMLVVALMLSVLISGCLGDDGSEDKGIEHPGPDEVQLFFNHTCFFNTRTSKFLELGGAPEGANITWTMDDEVIGYGENIMYTPIVSKYSHLRVDVTWGPYQKKHSRWIMIQERDDRGGYEHTSNGYGETGEYSGGYAINVRPAITIPSLMFNVSATKMNGTLSYYLRLMDDSTNEYFETVIDEQVNLSGGDHERSFYFNKLFFMEHGEHEPYLMFFLYIIESHDGSATTVSTENWLDY